MHNSALWLLPLSIIFLISLAGALFAKRFHKPSLIAYIILGILANNIIPLPQEVRAVFQPLANLGIVLLLFTIGLELNINRLLRSGKYVIYGALLQITLSAIFIFGVIAVWFGDIRLAFILAIPLALSSTAVVGKLLQENGEDSSLTGDITLGILIFQDVVSIFLITFFTFFATTAGGGIGWDLVKTIFGLTMTVVVLLYGGLLVVNKVFEKGKLNREELSLFIFAILFFVLWFFSERGVPETTAGFLVGLLFAQRLEQHEIFSQVRVFRDILLVLFFFFLGTFITAISIPIIALSALFAVLVMLGKFFIVWLLFTVLGFHRKTSYWISFDLMQLGEFAFVILAILGMNNSITSYQYQFFLLVIVWSLLLFSLVYKQKLAFYQQLGRVFGGLFATLESYFGRINQPIFDQKPYKNHTIICGYGRVGSYVGHGLMLSGIEVVVIDTNPTTVKRLQQKAIQVIYGDATEPEIMDYAQVEHARFLVVALPNPLEQEKIITAARKLNPSIRIITRSHLNRQLRHLKTLGIEFVIQPEFEAAVSILKKILKMYHIEKEQVKKRIRYLKIEHGMDH